MRFPRSLLFPLALACPLWLAACNQPASAPPDDDAPPPMTGTAGDAADAAQPPEPSGASADLGTDSQAPAAGDGSTGTAMPAGEGDSRSRIEKLLGDADQYEQVFKALQQGVASGDRAAVAALVRYPLRVETDGKKREIADAAIFQREYDSIVTVPVARAIAAQSFDTVFANWQGVMIGNGQVWLNGTCEDAACTRSDVKVVTIQQ